MRPARRSVPAALAGRARRRPARRAARGFSRLLGRRLRELRLVDLRIDLDLRELERGDAAFRRARPLEGDLDARDVAVIEEVVVLRMDAPFVVALGVAHAREQLRLLVDVER